MTLATWLKRWSDGLLLYDPGTLGFTPSTSLSLGSQVSIPFFGCHLPGPLWVTLNYLRWRKGLCSIRTNTSFQLLLPLVSALKIPVAIDEVSMAPSCSLGPLPQHKHSSASIHSTTLQPITLLPYTNSPCPRRKQ